MSRCDPTGRCAPTGYYVAHSPNSIHTLGGRYMMHLVVQRLIDDCTVFEHNLAELHLPVVYPSQGVLHPIDIITVWVILVGMSTSGFVSVLSRDHLLHGLIQKILELEGLDQVRIPDHAAVGGANILVFLHHLLDHDATLLQIC